MPIKNSASDNGLLRILKVVGGYRILFFALMANITEGISKVLIASNSGKMLDSIISFNKPQAVMYMLLILVFIILMAIGIIVKDSLLGSYQEMGMVCLREKTLNALGHAKMSWLDEKHSGELSARVSNDLNSLGGALRPVLIMGLSLVVLQIISVGYMFSLNWLLTLLIFAIVPVTTALQWTYSRFIKKYRAANQDAMGKLSSVVYDSVGGFETVKSLSLENEMMSRFSQAQARQYEASVSETRIVAALTPLSLLGQFLPRFMLVFAGGIFIIHGKLSIGQMMMFLVLSSSATHVLGDMVELISAIRQLSVNAERIVKLWDVPVELAGGEIIAPEIQESVISLANVSFIYNSGSGSGYVLKNVTFNINTGEFVALVGESGCGKSTALKLAAALYAPNEGTVKILSRDIKLWNTVAMRSNIAYVTQETYLFPGTLRENITSGKKDVTGEKINAAIEAAQLSDFIREQPMGLDTQVDEWGASLSGGQRQRISVARALCKDAKILLLDEATSALDQTNEFGVVNTITTLKNRPVLLMITHRLANIKNADRIIVFKDGHVCEQGTHAELERMDGEYTRLLEKQRGDVAF